MLTACSGSGVTREGVDEGQASMAMDAFVPLKIDGGREMMGPALTKPSGRPARSVRPMPAGRRAGGGEGGGSTGAGRGRTSWCL